MSDQRITIGIANNSPITQLISENRRVFAWEKLWQDMSNLSSRRVFSNAPCTLEQIFIPQSFRIGNITNQLDLLDYLSQLSWQEIKSLTDPIMLFGNFGQGKSSALRVLATKSANSSTPYRAVYVPLRDLALFDTDLISALIRYLQKYGEFDLHNVPEPTLLLMDGFDELSLYAGDIEKIGKSYAQLRQLGSHTNLYPLISSRPLAFLEHEHLLERNPLILRISNFSEAQVTQWLNRWNSMTFSQCKIGIDDINNRQLGGIVSNPLLLYMVALIFESELTERRPYSSGEIYDKFISFTERGKFRDDVHLPHPVPSNYRHVLQDLALTIHQFGEGGELIDAHTLNTQLRHHNEATIQAIIRPNLLLVAHFFEETSIGEKRFIEFQHKSLREYLVAERIVRYVLHAGIPVEFSDWARMWAMPFSMEIFGFVRDLLKMIPAKELRALVRSQQAWLSIFDCHRPAPLFKMPWSEAPGAVDGTSRLFSKKVSTEASAFVILSTIADQLGEEANALLTELMQRLPGLRAACMLAESSDGADFAQTWPSIVASISNANLLTSIPKGFELAHIRLRSGRLSGDMNRVSLASATLIGVEVDLGEIELCEWTAVNFEQSSMSIRRAKECSFFSAVFEKQIVGNSRFTRCSFDNSHWWSTTAEACIFSASSMRGARFTDILFVRCRFESTGFDRCDFDNVVFKECEFVDVTWGRLKRLGVVFENCKGTPEPT